MRDFLVIGLGRFGFEVATKLQENGADVFAIDKDKEIVEDIKDKVTNASSLDSTDINELKTVQISDIDTVIVAIGNNIEANILTTAILKELGARNIIARSLTKLHGKILKRTGAKMIISPEIQAAHQLAKKLVSPEVLETFSFSEGYSLVEIKASRKFWGKTVLETGIRDKFNLLIIGIETKEAKINDEGDIEYDSKMVHLPDANTLINEDNVLLIVGEDRNIEKLANYGKE